MQELKEQRKEAKKGLAVATRCMRESLYAHLGIPMDVKVAKPEIVLEPVDRETSEMEVVSTNSEPEMTKELYEKLTDKEKAEWLGLLDCKMEKSIPLFISKLESIGIVYEYGEDAL